MKTMDKTTRASMPGALQVSRKKYVRYFTDDKDAQQSMYYCSFLPWMFRKIPVIGPQVKLWVQIQEHFKHGCLNPAKVIDRSNNLIAVFTDLTARGDDPTSVILIKKERLDLISHKPVENGTRFAAPSVYYATEESRQMGRWNHFYPIVADCMIAEPGVCIHALERIKPAGWESLETGLQSIDIIEEGLYHVEVPSDLVRASYQSSL